MVPVVINSRSSTGFELFLPKLVRDLMEFPGFGEGLGKSVLFRIEDEEAMSVVSNSVETVNAAAAAIAFAGSRVQQVSVPVCYHLLVAYCSLRFRVLIWLLMLCS